MADTTDTAAIQMPPRVSVNSKLLSGIAYHPESETLEVQFLASGGVYRYHGIGEDDYQALMRADSIGAHFLRHIKPSYDFTKVEPQS